MHVTHYKFLLKGGKLKRRKFRSPFVVLKSVAEMNSQSFFSFMLRDACLIGKNFLMKISFIPFCLLFRTKNRISRCKARSSKLNIYDVKTRSEWMKKKIILRTGEINFETFYKHFNYDYTYSFYAFSIRCYARNY